MPKSAGGGGRAGRGGGGGGVVAESLGAGVPPAPVPGPARAPIRATPGAVKNALQANGVHPDSVGRNARGDIVVRKQFFYRSGRSEETWKNDVSRAVGNNFRVVNYGEHNAPFSGRASAANSNHWYVELRPH